MSTKVLGTVTYFIVFLNKNKAFFSQKFACLYNSRNYVPVTLKLHIINKATSSQTNNKFE